MSPKTGVCLHVTEVGRLTNDGAREAVHFLVTGPTEEAALEAYQAQQGSEAEYWVAYRSAHEAERWLDKRGVASYRTIEA